MMPQQNDPLYEEPTRPLGVVKDPARSRRSLAIAMVFAVLFLIIAVGIIVWLFVMPRNPVVTGSQATEDVRDVKNVTLVAPADLPANYAKTEQSTNDQTRTYYYDDATNCGFTVGVAAANNGKTAKETATATITSAQAQGITVAGQSDGSNFELYDADDADTTYEFGSVTLDQDVKVDGVAFTQQNNVIVYKQFGNKIAVLSYACKAETWTSKKVELATLVSKFTVKTER